MNIKAVISFLFTGIFIFQAIAIAGGNFGSSYGYRQQQNRRQSAKQYLQRSHIESSAYQKNQRAFIKGIQAYNKKRMRRPSYGAPKAGDKTGRSVVRPAPTVAK